ncbi:MAG: radical SAM protein [Candidatus Methanomethylophilaceae archaeon]|jgi:uncharacterized protein
MNPFISVVIKPILACDLDCRHCYHRPEERVPSTITYEALDRLFRMLSEEFESVWFIWHGGEPLMLPLQFYRYAIDLQNKYFGKGTHRVGNTIQTNGTAIDRKFSNFCKENQINIGVSFEGPCDGVLRQKCDLVDKNLTFLSKKEHIFSVSSTIAAEDVGRQTELYRYFRGRDINVSFSPVVPMGCAADNRELVPDADEYIAESIRMFDEWLYDKDTDIALIPHYLYLLNALGEPVDSDCAHNSCLTKWLCVYPNGDLYPCAKGCPSKYMMGNLFDIEAISEAFAGDGFREILLGTIARREKCKAECEIFRYCNGGCSMDASCECGIENNGGDSCRIFKAVFTHIQKTVDDILNEKPDLSQYNRFVRDAIVGKLVNPKITSF